MTGRDGPTRGQARGPDWRQTSWGYYVPAGVSDDLPEQRIMEQSVRLTPGGAVTGWASGRLFGANFMDGLRPDGRTRIPVPLALGVRGNIRGDEQVTLTYDPLDPAEVVVRFRIPCTTRERGVFDAMRSADDLREAVVAIDKAAAAEITSIRRMLADVAAHPGWHGAPLARAALGLASERSRSPNETRVRLGWVLDAGLAEPLVNRPVFTLDGRLIGVPDLLDEEAGVVGEFDGADHRGAPRHSQDVGREDLFRRQGLEYFKVTGPDMPHRGRIVERMITTRDRAAFAPPSERRWTTEPPPWWEREPSLDLVLDERDRRARLYEQWEREGWAL